MSVVVDGLVNEENFKVNDVFAGQAKLGVI